jgi:radical SAM-linked protein
LVLVKFTIAGHLRFLSHLEQLALFQRACVRACVSLAYTQGFNPHPIISLPLPRSVGVESDDDFLCLRVNASMDSFDAERFQSQLSLHLPAGLKLLSVSTSPSKALPVPLAAEYLIPIKNTLLNDNVGKERLKSTIDSLLASESLIVQRQSSPKMQRIKNVDVRTFIDDIILNDQGLAVHCNISAGGSIRIDEILSLSGLSIDCLSGPVKRKSVQWKLDGLQ